MANIAVQRIKREFKEVLKSEETSKNQIKVDLVDENFTELRGEIAGPPDTPYEGIATHLHCNDLARYLLPHLSARIFQAKTFFFLFLGFFPGNLISNNHNQIKTFVKCPSCFFFLKNGSTKEAKEQQTQRKKIITCF
uniref:Ubiquitin conjugating enzyme E2 K n=1 Tax=Stegastes partitus TaxID=144197 RepID=A0A3B5B0Q0_9TELE